MPSEGVKRQKEPERGRNWIWSVERVGERRHLVNWAGNRESGIVSA
jgi:hypothetical protein